MGQNLTSSHTTRRSVGRMHHPIRWLWLMELTVVAGAAGCAAPAPALSVPSVGPSVGMEQLLALPPPVGLTEEQSAALRSLYETSQANRHTLDLHVAEESQRLKQQLDKEGSIRSPEVWAQISLVSQLKTEQALMAARLRERVWELLTPEQRLWLVRNR
jgi:Spy/CpxP family protein refolding chaperone